MTFTIVARCSRSGQVGIGIATYSIGVGLYCNGLRSNAGATMTQAFVNQAQSLLNSGSSGGTPLTSTPSSTVPSAAFRGK